MESSYIRRPPRYAGQSHIQACCQLISHTVKAGGNVSGPYKSSVFLTSGPCTTKQVDNIFLSLLLHSVIKGSGIFQRIDVSDFQIGSHVITIIIKIVSAVFRLRHVQPEYTNAFVIIVFLNLIPKVFSCFRIRHITGNRRALEIQTYTSASFRTDQISLFEHFIIIFTFRIHGWPDGNHQFHTHFLQLLNHCIRIRPVYRIKFPVSLLFPVEVINHNKIQRQISSFTIPYSDRFCDMYIFYNCPQSKALEQLLIERGSTRDDILTWVKNKMKINCVKRDRYNFSSQIIKWFLYL